MDSIDVDVAVYTNLTGDIIDADPDTVAIALAAQTKLFRRLTDPDRQRAIINIDGMLFGLCLGTLWPCNAEALAGDVHEGQKSLSFCMELLSTTKAAATP